MSRFYLIIKSMWQLIKQNKRAEEMCKDINWLTREYPFLPQPMREEMFSTQIHLKWDRNYDVNYLREKWMLNKSDKWINEILSVKAINKNEMEVNYDNADDDDNDDND